MDLIKASLGDVVKALQQGRISSERLVCVYLDAIAKDNIDGRGHRAVFETLDRQLAIDTARGLDEEREQGKVKSPLHGVPIIVKDHMGTGPDLGMSTTGGLPPLVGSRCKQDSPVVRRLREQGLIILGKASMTVMHNVYDPSIIDSWNPILGRAKGAFNPLRPFGSSSGSAISLALGWCASSIGGEISGSIIAPCSSAALYGLKPTVGLISDGCEGNLEISERYDVAGPMGKTVQDLEMMLDIMAKDSDKSKLKPTTPAGRAQGKEGKWRVAVLDYAPHFGDAPDPDAPAKVHYDASIAKLHSHSAFEMLFESSSELAAKCASAPTFPKGIWKITGDAMFADSAGGRKHSSSAMYTHFAADSYHLYNRFLSQLNWPAGVAPIRMAEELVEALKNMPNQHVDESGTDGSVKHLDSMLAGKGNKESPEYKDATKFCDEAKEELRAFTRDNKLDAIIGPLRMYSLSGIGATPLGTVPTGVCSDGDPGHFLIMGNAFAERDLLRMMSACEELFGPRPVPRAREDQQAAS